MKKIQEKISAHLAFIYKDKDITALTNELIEIINDYKEAYPELAATSPQGRVSEKDVILITYGDMVQKADEAPLKTLSEFLQKYFGDVINAVHILPFFPYSSDDGFSVIDYRQVNPNLGEWEDIAELGENFRLMFDAVVNHISAESTEFQGFLKGDPKYKDFFTVTDPNADISKVFRPRSLPLLTPFQTPEGEKHVWTTFSADQIDLNFANPAVLFEVIKVLLFYVAHCAEFIRLDAVTYLWKDIETSCANLPETHRIIQLVRTVLDEVAPRTALITETNVPHQDNIAYFGDGLNEAQMVYNFVLPPIVLHSFQSGNAEKLSQWATTLELPSNQATFFNFLASHDGIGLTPTKNILTPEEINDVVQRTQNLGGNIGYKSNGDGSKSPYELNINYLSALGDPQNPIAAKRFLAAQSIMLALRGVPGIYFQSLIGSENWSEGVEKYGYNRAINRQKLPIEKLESELSLPSLRQRVYQGYHHLLDIRQTQPAFHPFGGQKVLNLHPSIFGLIRTSLDEDQNLLCLHNISDQEIEIALDLNLLPFKNTNPFSDIISDKSFPISNGKLKLHLAPYEVLWLK